jgi:Protein of unknown function (DUF3489)
MRKDKPMTKKAKAARGAHKPKGDGKTRRARRQETERPSKKTTCLALLERAEGASIAELQQATGWRAHSVRGFLAGTVSKMAGLALSSTKTSGERRYHVRRTGS